MTDLTLRFSPSTDWRTLSPDECKRALFNKQAERPARYVPVQRGDRPPSVRKKSDFQLCKDSPCYVTIHNRKQLYSALEYLTPDSVCEGRHVPNKSLKKKIAFWRKQA